MMTVSYLTAIVKVSHYAEDTFYAADLGLAGGSIQGLEYHGYIERTGNYKEYTIPAGGNLLRVCKSLEWRIVRREPSKWARPEMERFIEDVLRCADMLRSECSL